MRVSGRYPTIALVLAVIAVMTVLILRSWVIDDAYITLRTIDNFVNGGGLRWNLTERVQAFTHPLWTFVLLIPYYFTREAYFTSLLTSLAISFLTIYLVGFRLSSDWLAAVLALAVLALSRAFIDFSASNLEGPLTHLLIALFVLIYFRRGESSRNRLIALSVVASLLALTRMDLALLVAPALAVRLWRQRPDAMRALMIGATPFTAWTIFAIVYYGFPFPNTAYAKLAHGVPAAEALEQGLSYLVECLAQDPLTLLGSLAMIGIGCLSARREGWPVAAGVVLYLAYVVGIGGDYMSGRFLAAPFLFSILFIVAGGADERVRRRQLAVLAILGALAFASKFVVTPEDRIVFLKQHFSDGDPKWERRRARGSFRHIIDPRRDDNPTALLRVLSNPAKEFRHEWIDLGRHVASRPDNVFAYGAVGLLGYYAGPRIHIVDAAALGDPLLARLPATFPWFPGHFDRRMPAGYLDSLRQGVNRLEDPNLRSYYDDLQRVTRGPIWSMERFRAIVRLNLNRHDVRLADYGAVTAVAEELPGEWSYANEAGTELWERGLRLRMATGCTARRLEIVVSGPAKYWLRYYAGGKLLATETLQVHDNEKQPIFAKVAADSEAFDRVDLIMATGAHPESVYRLRFSH